MYTVLVQSLKHIQSVECVSSMYILVLTSICSISIYLYTYVCNIYVYTHTFTHTHTHTHFLSLTHICVCVYIYIYIYIYIYMYVSVCVVIYAYTLTRIVLVYSHIYTCTCAHAQAETCAYTCIYRHTPDTCTHAPLRHSHCHCLRVCRKGKHRPCGRCTRVTRRRWRCSSRPTLTSTPQTMCGACLVCVCVCVSVSVS